MKEPAYSEFVVRPDEGGSAGRHLPQSESDRLPRAAGAAGKDRCAVGRGSEGRGMKPIKPCTMAGIRAAREALERGEPMSLAEIAEFNHARAVEMARAEAARESSPQLVLGEAA